MKMTFLQSLLGLGVAAPGFSLAVADSPQKGPLRPNVIFIMADDLGIGDLGIYGQEIIPTPNLDRLANEGMLFDNFYAGGNVCAPSRCTLLTGRHTGHSSIRGNLWQPDVGVATLSDDDVTIPEALKGSGYVTGLCGRWHLGGEKSRHTPSHRGFDYHFGKLSSLHRNKGGVFIDQLWDENGVHIPLEEYRDIQFEPMYEDGAFYNLSADEIQNRPMNMDVMVTDKAIDFIEQNRHNPFFLYVAYSLPHAPMEMHHEMAMKDGTDWPEVEQAFASMLRQLDMLVGRIVAKVDASGLAENTLIFFTSDNGPHMEGGHDAEFFNSNGRFLGYKRDLYEGGIRMPAIARWQGTIPAGSTTAHQAAFWDVQATVCDMAGVAPPKNTDGISFLPTLLGKNQPEHEYLYWESREISHMGIDKGYKQAIRRENWKLIRFFLPERVELYNLKDDPTEENNVAGAHPEIVKELLGKMEEARVRDERFLLPFEKGFVY